MDARTGTDCFCVLEHRGVSVPVRIGSSGGQPVTHVDRRAAVVVARCGRKAAADPVRCRVHAGMDVTRAVPVRGADLFLLCHAARCDRRSGRRACDRMDQASGRADVGYPAVSVRPVQPEWPRRARRWRGPPGAHRLCTSESSARAP